MEAGPNYKNKRDRVAKIFFCADQTRIRGVGHCFPLPDRDGRAFVRPTSVGRVVPTLAMATLAHGAIARPELERSALTGIVRGSRHEKPGQ
jgi:hypothetical protein